MNEYYDNRLETGEFAEGFGEYDENRMARRLKLSFKLMSIRYRAEITDENEDVVYTVVSDLFMTSGGATYIYDAQGLKQAHITEVGPTIGKRYLVNMNNGAVFEVVGDDYGFHVTHFDWTIDGRAAGSEFTIRDAKSKAVALINVKAFSLHIRHDIIVLDQEKEDVIAAIAVVLARSGIEIRRNESGE